LLEVGDLVIAINLNFRCCAECGYKCRNRVLKITEINTQIVFSATEKDPFYATDSYHHCWFHKRDLQIVTSKIAMELFG
jgi:hypothetical protein